MGGSIKKQTADFQQIRS